MRNATSKFTYILRTLSFTFSKSKGSSLLSRLAKNFPVNIVAVITCGVVDIDYEVMAEAQKRQRQQRAKEVKRLDFPFLVITRKQEKRRHILDDFELDYEIEAAEGQEMKLQYTDAFREGNVLFGEAFEGYDSNPVCNNPPLCSFLLGVDEARRAKGK